MYPMGINDAEQAATGMITSVCIMPTANPSGVVITNVLRSLRSLGGKRFLEGKVNNAPVDDIVVQDQAVT